MTVEPSYRIVEDDPEFGQYRDLTENKYQPLPDGVMRWYSNQHHSYATPDGYLVPDFRLQAIADAWKKWLNAVETATDSTEVLNAWKSFEKEVGALVKGEQP
ncbi:hypothetical protein LCGC14_2334560 [marine sediment metagenome]|uniref:Uncharacterized protein n=1 Tax=marine sediment metagenome TaxID=412755 RepID=A0A0F9CEP5_9ZZZZ